MPDASKLLTYREICSKFYMLMLQNRKCHSLLVYRLGYGPFKAEGGVRFPGGEKTFSRDERSTDHPELFYRTCTTAKYRKFQPYAILSSQHTKGECDEDHLLYIEISTAKGDLRGC